jgi:5-formyltetrahydrofolate cyclo-ligase
MPADNKTSLRRELIAARKKLSFEQIQERSKSICQRIRQMDAWNQAREVLAYLPKGGEVDVEPLVRDLWERGARVLLPRCRPGEPGVMDLACPAGIEEVAPGAYGIPEPLPDACPALESCTPDLVIVPGVAFDRYGRRLGMGGGYYDRLLVSGMLDNPLLVAPAFGFQLIGTVPSDPWDRLVNVIVTEEETLWI